jgi:hypothetical protein
VPELNGLKETSMRFSLHKKEGSALRMYEYLQNTTIIQNYQSHANIKPTKETAVQHEIKKRNYIIMWKRYSKNIKIIHKR